MALTATVVADAEIITLPAGRRLDTMCQDCGKEEPRYSLALTIDGLAVPAVYLCAQCGAPYVAHVAHIAEGGLWT